MKKKYIITLCALIIFTGFIFASCGSGAKSQDTKQDVQQDIKQDVKQEPHIINPAPEDYKGQALITLSYDDGYKSIYEIALPLHEKYNVPATFNIIAGKKTNKNPKSIYMNKEMVRDAYNRGAEIASHAYYHIKSLTKENDTQLKYELSQSKTVLESIINDKVTDIAIPFSEWNTRVLSTASKYYKGVRVNGAKPNYIPFNKKYNEIYSTTSVDNKTKFDSIKKVIDKCVKDKTWCVIMLHGIDKNKDTKYEITPQLLEQILQYISSIGRDKLLPINTKGALELKR